MKKIIFFIILPIVAYVGLLLYLYFVIFIDFKISINIAATIIQSLAIIIGGLWAYHKFGWEKKCENIITLKASLMKYRHEHNFSAAQFRKDGDIGGYKMRLLESYNNLSKKIHLSYYVSAILRKKIFDTIWLTIGNDHGNINQNWDKFEKQIEEIYIEFDKIISL